MSSFDIREHGAKYRAAIETSGDGFCISDMSGRFLEFNDAYVNLIGYSPEELLNMSVPDIEAQQTATEIAATLEKARCEGHAIFETKLRSKDGRVWPAELNLSYWPIGGGRIFVFLRDITARKKAEEALRESEERYRSIFLESHAVMLLIDPETGAIIDANPAASSYYGYTKEELNTKLITDINILPADQVMAEMQRAQSGECRQFIFQHRLANGKLQDVEVFSGPIHYHGKILLHSIVHDISARRIAEEALRESEERLRLLGDNLPENVVYQYVHEPDGSVRFLYVSAGIEQLNGVRVQDVLNDAGTLHKQALPEYYERLVKAEALSAQELSDFEMEVQMRRPDGQLRWMQLHSRPRRMPDGRTIWDGVQTDITERKRAEEALREAQRDLNRAQAVAHTGSWRLNLRRNELLWSEETYRIFGIAPDTLMNYEVFLSAVHPEDREFVDREWTAALGGKQYDIEHRIVVGDTVKWVRERAELDFGAQGELLSGFGTVQNITERKRAEEALRESEEKYRGLIETTSTGYVIVNTEGKVLDANPEYLRLTGYNELKEILGRSVIEWTKEQDRVKNAAAIKHCLQTGFIKNLELDYAGRDGQTIPVEINATAISTSEGIKFLGLVRDISNRKRVEEEKTKLEAQLVQAQKMEAIGTLAGGIAHDFNNILFAIMGNISLVMLDHQMKEASRERLTEAEKACLQAQKLSQQLLTLSKGGTPIKEVISVKNLITESASFACRGSQVNYELNLSDNLWGVEADRGQLSQVFQNLIINAIQAMPTGGMIKIRGENIVVAAGTELPLSPGRYVSLSFQDQGMGIPTDYLAKIFDPYFTTKQKGSGLGLAISYSIIKKHYGHIAVESILGEGTAFIIYLPASDRKVIQQPKEDRELHSGKGKILIMDDEAMVREVLNHMLVSLGYDVKLCADGVEAIELFGQSEKSGESFNAVILDLTVPGGMGGKETITRLLKINPKVRAIVSSGYSNDPIMAEFHKYGFTAVITKPYGVVELGNILQKVIEKRLI